MNEKVKELKQLQEELCDKIITQPNELEKIIRTQLQARHGFYNYTLRNLVLASAQLYDRTGEGIEILANFKEWKKHGRFVKKGEKALYVLAPVFKKIIKEDENGEEIENSILIGFRATPVFDLSQTTGERLEKDFTTANVNYTLEEIINRGTVKVNKSGKELTRGYTDGKEIWISEHISTPQQICVYFHELAHYLLHFDENRDEISRPTRELEAEAVSFIVSSYLGIHNEESPAYILNWTKEYDTDERTELLKGKGSQVLNTAQNIINILKLDELVNPSQEVPVSNDAVSVET